MGINRILRKRGVIAAGIEYDVLIPLPANNDVCLKKIGIHDFEDTGDEWDANFCEIFECLTNGEQFQVTAFNPNTGDIGQIKPGTLSDIRGYLVHYDHLNYVIHLKGRSNVGVERASDSGPRCWDSYAAEDNSDQSERDDAEMGSSARQERALGTPIHTNAPYCNHAPGHEAQK